MRVSIIMDFPGWSLKHGFSAIEKHPWKPTTPGEAGYKPWRSWTTTERVSWQIRRVVATQWFFLFISIPGGNDPTSRAYFSNGLKPPTSSMFSGVRLKGKTNRPWMYGKFTINVSMAIVFSANLEIPDLRLWGFMPVKTRLPTTIRTLSGGHEVSFWKFWKWSVLLRDQPQFLWENRTTLLSHQTYFSPGSSPKDGNGAWKDGRQPGKVTGEWHPTCHAHAHAYSCHPARNAGTKAVLNIPKLFH